MQNQIENCESTDTLRNLLDSAEFAFRFECGCSMPSSSVAIEDKYSISRCISMHYVIYLQKAELDQIKEGFQVISLDRNQCIDTQSGG